MRFHFSDNPLKGSCLCRQKTAHKVLELESTHNILKSIIILHKIDKLNIIYSSFHKFTCSLWNTWIIFFYIIQILLLFKLLLTHLKVNYVLLLLNNIALMKLFGLTYIWILLNNWVTQTQLSQTVSNAQGNTWF